MNYNNIYWMNLLEMFNNNYFYKYKFNKNS